MTKIEAMQRVNGRLGSIILHENNTFWSACGRYGGDEGWWLKIPLASFKSDIHIILNRESGKVFLHLKIKAREILSPAMKFRCTDQMAEMFIPAANMRRLGDILPGGSKHGLTKNIVAEYRF